VAVHYGGMGVMSKVLMAADLLLTCTQGCGAI
jgi:hypothetical protein